jgi:hypothetical protein
MASDTLFRQKAPGIMNLLMADFGLDLESAAAILGNLGHESGGFQFLQEKQPMIAGSAGGYGWAQWTGPRRRAYEAYCERNGFDPASDTANYKFLFVELSGSERAAIPAVKNAVGLEAKVKAFEMAFERAGIKHYDGRMAWAERALEAYRANPGGTIDVRDAAGAPAKEGEILPPAILGGPQLDLGRILAMLLPLLQHVISDPKLRDTVLPLVFQILGVKPDAAKPGEPVAPPKPPTQPMLTDTDKTMVKAGGTGLVLTTILQALGVVGTPFGTFAEPSTIGTLLTTVTGGAAMAGMTGGWGMLARVGISLLGGLAGRLAPK